MSPSRQVPPRSHPRCSLIYVKIPKAASSSAGGLARRIGERNGLRGARADLAHDSPKGASPVVGFPSNASSSSSGTQGPTKTTAEVWANHRVYRKLAIPFRRYFLWTMVRDPGARCASWAAARSKTTVRALGANCANFQFKYMRPEACKDAACVHSTYDFVGLVEAFDASATALARLLDVPLADVLYLVPAKSSAAKNRTATPEVRAYVGSAAFRATNALDYELWRRARDAVAALAAPAAVDEYKALRHDAVRFCEVIAQHHHRREHRLLLDSTVGPPRTPPAKDCYWGDNGCGVTCLDAFAAAEQRRRHQYHGVGEAHPKKQAASLRHNDSAVASFFNRTSGTTTIGGNATTAEKRRLLRPPLGGVERSFLQETEMSSPI
mmetsp:Transcript_14196/g.56589  ORF Transcript_14196/g.56589 Transcript_14196/m.56589 type:complete len:381 (-) Transcript_14196:55-1197(-)